MQQRNLIGVLLLGRKCLDVISSNIQFVEKVTEDLLEKAGICKSIFLIKFEFVNITMFLSFPFFITANIIVPKGLAAKGSRDILHKKRYKITKWGNSKTM